MVVVCSTRRRLREGMDIYEIRVQNRHIYRDGEDLRYNSKSLRIFQNYLLRDNQN